jgi:hypothetical protein
LEGENKRCGGVTLPHCSPTPTSPSSAVKYPRHPFYSTLQLGPLSCPSPTLHLPPPPPHPQQQTVRCVKGRSSTSKKWQNIYFKDLRQWLFWKIFFL